MSTESLMLSKHLIYAAHFSFCLQFFSASRLFPISQFFTSGGQNIGASASAPVFPMNTYGWFPLGLTGLISLLVQGTLKSLLQHHSSKHHFSIVRNRTWVFVLMKKNALSWTFKQGELFLNVNDIKTHCQRLHLHDGDVSDIEMSMSELMGQTHPTH